jgi:hypothetical protein
MTLHGAITPKTTPYISTNMTTSELKHSVSKILGHTSEVNSQIKTRKKSSYQCMLILRFQGTPQHSVDLNPLDLNLLGCFKTLVHSAPTEYKETQHQHIFYAGQTIRNCPGPFKGCNSPLSDMSMCALNQVENILSSCCEL